MSFRVYDRNGKPWIDLRVGATFRRRLPIFGTGKRAVSFFVERLAALAEATVAGYQPEPHLLEWFYQLPGDVRDRLARYGIVSATRAAVAEGIAVHLSGYAEHLRSMGRTARHIKETLATLGRMAEALRWRAVADITAGPLEERLRDIVESGKAARTANAELVAAKAFCNFLIRRDVLPASPLARVGRLGGEEVKRRRALSDQDFGKLLAAADNGPAFRCMTGREWGIVFRVAATTGLRWSELRSLRRDSFEFGNAGAAVFIGGESTKNGQDAALPVRSDVAELLQGYFDECPALPSAPAFPMPKGNCGARVLRRYLDLAGIPYAENGREFDFHSLRGQLATSLCRAGIPLATARDLMRHSTVELTARHYIKLELHDRRRAVEAMAAVEATPAMTLLTGTDDGIKTP